MRIGIVLAAVPGYSETFFRSKIRFLQETKGVEVILFADQRISRISWKDCKVVYAPSLSGRHIWSKVRFGYQIVKLCITAPLKSLRLLSMNKQSGFNIRKNVISLMQSAHILNDKLDWIHYGFGTMAIGRENVAKVMGAKMAVSFRGFDIAIYPLKHPKCYDLTWENADKVHVISDDLAALVSTCGYDKAKPLIKITPAIDTRKFIPSEKSQPLTNPLKIVTVARLHWKKGLEYTLDALCILNQKNINFQYTIIGHGEEFERLVFAAHQLGLKDRVIFAGKLSSDEVITQLNKSDLYIQYSIQEGFCNAVLEAQAMGLLCIVSDAEGLRENVLHDETGWVVPKRNAAALAKQIQEAIGMSNQTLIQIRSRAMQRVERCFNLDKQKNFFLDFYEHNK